MYCQIHNILKGFSVFWCAGNLWIVSLNKDKSCIFLLFAFFGCHFSLRCDKIQTVTERRERDSWNTTFLARLYKSTGRAIAVTTASASASVSALLKFLVKIFKSLYLLNLWMDLVDILPDVRYWSEVLCCTILTHINDPEVKVTDFEILCFWLNFLEVYIFWSFSLILLILCLILDTGLNFRLHHPHPLTVLEVKVTNWNFT